MRSLIVILAVFLLFDISYADPQGDKNREILLKNAPNLTPEEYKVIKARIDAEEQIRREQVNNARSSIKINKYWGTCFKNCYDLRNDCFDVGGDVIVCEPLYDKCLNDCY